MFSPSNYLLVIRDYGRVQYNNDAMTSLTTVLDLEVGYTGLTEHVDIHNTAVGYAKRNFHSSIG